ncbi:GNAT family N-acetyltransferase [Cognatishimia sp. 1_MG-2023]|uniref:GNAT family N-acetyltransferase n=1 Tax=Cognatishimia sp. 1_MG-2023 TaxID=3062642 RepID=UPI0026E48F6A|nr:GNAT family N-acetyltransferase [Cognatishimia sp. 1_MG-2023]MDO6726817.1 GNAT family N-acetyltransferase [Cognatishimia sp. 1_MG-2023]
MTDTPIITTDRLILRKPAARDLDSVVAFFQSERAEYVGGPYTMGKAWRQFAAEVGHWDLLGYGMWAVTTKDNDNIIGLIGPWTPGDWPETEIGWFMLNGSEGKGYAFEAAQAALHHAFEVLDWETAVSYIDKDNIRSIALAERLGAKLDPEAPQPKPDQPCLIYRHPRPEPDGNVEAYA